MNLDLGLTESEEMLKKAALDFMRRDAPKEVIQAFLFKRTPLPHADFLVSDPWFTTALSQSSFTILAFSLTVCSQQKWDTF